MQLHHIAVLATPAAAAAALAAAAAAAAAAGAGELRQPPLRQVWGPPKFNTPVGALNHEARQTPAGAPPILLQPVAAAAAAAAAAATAAAPHTGRSMHR